MPTRDETVPGMVERALAGESGDPGLILVPSVTHSVALWLGLDSSQAAWVPVPDLELTGWVTWSPSRFSPVGLPLLVCRLGVIGAPLHGRAFQIMHVNKALSPGPGNYKELCWC